MIVFVFSRGISIIALSGAVFLWNISIVVGTPQAFWTFIEDTGSIVGMPLNLN